jgi:circadian clock protein KaiB
MAKTIPVKAMAPVAALERYVLRLYVAGTSPGSTRAVETLTVLCDQHLRGRYDLEIVDVYQQPQLALDDQIIAVPMLLRRSPLPVRRLLGDLSDMPRVLRGLDLKPSSDEKKRSPSRRP